MLWNSFQYLEPGFVAQVPAAIVTHEGSLFLNEEQPPFLSFMCKTGQTAMLNSSLMKIYLFVHIL